MPKLRNAAPLRRGGIFRSTNSDGSRSDEFCYYCLKDGKYIVDISMWEMIDIWIKYTDKYNEYADTDYSPKEPEGDTGQTPSHTEQMAAKARDKQPSS
ncbi:zinc ribbon domain-containing protein [Bacteroides thetaiotaomicron]|nr:zinc ribbon domain-containing protein [Bacteroides thetaiotaomicron]